MICVIICSVDDRRFAAVQANYRSLLAAGEFEIIRIPDARSMCEGYNRGFAASRGDVLVFSHDDIEILSADFRQRLLGHLEQSDLIGVAGTRLLGGPAWGWVGPPHLYGQVGAISAARKELHADVFSAPTRHVGKIQALDGLFLACRRHVVQAIGFDEQTFTSFHHYDTDFSYRAFLAGMKVGVACDLDIIHHSEGKFGDEWAISAERFMKKHQRTLRLLPMAQWARTRVRVENRDQLRARFHPPHWDD